MRILLSVFLVSLTCAADPIRVVTTVTELAWVAREIGGERVKVTPLLKGTEDPHHVDTVPEFIHLVAEAQVVCVVGLDLEVGWMPKVLARSGNAGVQPGGKGYCETGKKIRVVEKPEHPVDRSLGDVHPAGNPHFWLSPLRLAEAAEAIEESLSQVDPEGASHYAERRRNLGTKLRALVEKGRKRLAPILGRTPRPKVMEYHREFAYLFETYGIESVGSVEEKPGVDPSAGRIGRVALEAKNRGVRVVLAGHYAPKQKLEQFSALSGAKLVRTATSIPSDGDYLQLHERLIEVLAEGL